MCVIQTDGKILCKAMLFGAIANPAMESPCLLRNSVAAIHPTCGITSPAKPGRTRMQWLSIEQHEIGHDDDGKLPFSSFALLLAACDQQYYTSPSHWVTHIILAEEDIDDKNLILLLCV